MMPASIVGPALGLGCIEVAQKHDIESQGMSMYYRKRFLFPDNAPYSIYRPYNRSQHHCLNPVDTL